LLGAVYSNMSSLLTSIAAVSRAMCEEMAR